MKNAGSTPSETDDHFKGTHADIASEYTVFITSELTTRSQVCSTLGPEALKQRRDINNKENTKLTCQIKTIQLATRDLHRLASHAVWPRHNSSSASAAHTARRDCVQNICGGDSDGGGYDDDREDVYGVDARARVCVCVCVCARARARINTIHSPGSRGSFVCGHNAQPGQPWFLRVLTQYTAWAVVTPSFMDTRSFASTLSIICGCFVDSHTCLLKTISCVLGSRVDSLCTCNVFYYYGLSSRVFFMIC